MSSFSCPSILKLMSVAMLVSGMAVFAVGQTHTAPSAHTIGSPNTVTADPSIVRPSTQPCVVQLFSNVLFADFSPKTFQYNPPADCPGPWAKVVFEGDFSITAGRQFDRTANIWIGGANVYFGTTPEPQATVARSWHVESDLTDYTPLFTVAQSGEAVLGNLVNSTFTSIITGSASVQFYPLARHQHAPRSADVVLPLSAGPLGGTVALNTSADRLARTFALPSNIEEAFLDVVAQSQSNDEFWYTCVPNDVANELQSCGSTAFREVEVTIDGQPAGVAPVYPWIYTGGIDPFLWRPIPGVETLNFTPYRVDLTPFAGVLSDGNQHQVALQVFNADSNFATTASLLLYLDEEVSHVTGAVTENTISAQPNPAVKENVSTASDGTITGTVSVTSNRKFETAGFVKTSHGNVSTEVSQSVNFSNSQNFNITNTVYVQDITQKTTIDSVTTKRGGGPPVENFAHSEYPLLLNFSFTSNPDGTFAQTTNINQQLTRQQLDSVAGSPVHFSSLLQTDTPNDTLLFNASFSVIGTQDQNSIERYFLRDSNGICYDRQISAANGVLTSASDGSCR